MMLPAQRSSLAVTVMSIAVKTMERGGELALQMRPFTRLPSIR
jgi:hypothetical protein